MRKKTTVWIIILNWNGLEDTLDCLESLSHLKLDDTEMQILVIDNNSWIDPCPVVNEMFPDVTVIRLNQNRGFAGGCNYGIKLAMEAQSDYVLLLNNDTTVHQDFLRFLVACAKSSPKVGIVAPMICYANKPDQVWFAGAKSILELGYFEHQYLNRRIDQVPANPFASDYVTGCCMLISASVINSVGMLDERFFAYFEDADFCLRARSKGYDVFCVPNSLIWHKESSSTRKNLTEGTTSPFKHYLFARNRIVMIIKHSNVLQLMFFLVATNTIIMFYYLCAFAVRRRWKKMVWFCRGIVDGVLQRFEHPGL